MLFGLFLSIYEVADFEVKHFQKEKKKDLQKTRKKKGL